MKTILLLTASLVVLKAFSQEDFRPGYIIDTRGNQIYGLVEYKPNLINYRVCYFKTDSLAEAVQYAPEQLAGYRLTDSKYFVSKTVPMHDMPEQYFLECLISGKASIYHMRRNNKDLFFIEKDSIFREIHNDDIYYYFEFDGSKFTYVPYEPDATVRRPQKTRQSYQYKGILKAMMNECPDINKEIDRLKFDRSSLIDISKTYHERVCRDEPCIIYEKKIVKTMLNVGFFVNSGLHTFTYDDRRFFQSYLKLNTNLPWGAGLLVQLSNRDINDRLFFQYAVSYQQLTVDEYVDQQFISNVLFQFDFGWLENEVSVNYRLRNVRARINPYVKLGVPLGILLEKEGSKEYRYVTEIEIDQKVFTGVNGGAGLEFKTGERTAAFLGIDYQYNSFLKDYINQYFTLKGFRFTLGYKFR